MKFQLRRCLNMVRFHSSGSEGRQCIRDVVNLQSTLLTRLRSSPRSSEFDFETYVAKSNIGNNNIFDESVPTCGNSVRCWAALFLSNSQINRDFLYQLVVGGLWSQALSNPNLLLYKLHSAFPSSKTDLLRNFPLFSVSSQQLWRHFLPISSKYCRDKATNNVTSFMTAMAHEDGNEVLPRVFFCSMSWVAMKRAMVASLNSSAVSASAAHDTTGAPAVEGADSDAQDHEFIIIKSRLSDDEAAACSRDSGALSFQMLQGYKNDDQGLHGYSIKDWQLSGNIYSSHQGFDLSSMRVLGLHMQAFLESPVWDEANHSSTFGVGEESFRGCEYVPSWSYRELLDEHIIGWGERPMINKLAHLLDEEECQ